MKKGKRLSKADALRVLTKAYNLIKNDNYAFICIAIERTAIELSLAERSCVACYLIPELKMFKPVNRKNGDFWFYTKKMRNDIHLYETLYWVSPIPSTGCSRVRSPDSFTELNVFDFTYPTNVLG